MTPDPSTVDPDSLTVGELATIEELCGLTLPEILVGFADGLIGRSPKFLLALILIAGSREDPAFDVEDAGAVPLTSFYRGDE